MKNIFLLSILAVFTSSLLAYSDADMDGVADEQDRCPNTPFMELVDINGCTKKTLRPKDAPSNHHFDIIVGANYSDSDYNTLNKTDTFSGALQVDYYYKNFSLQASTSYFNTQGSGYSEKGLYDSFLGASYQFKPLQNLTFRLGAGAVLPTYDSSLNNNNTDYTGSASVSYTVSGVNIFGGYNYTMINDDDVYIDTGDVNTSRNVQYQDTNSYNAGLGYYVTDQLYMSASYNVMNSVYVGVDDIESASVYAYYGINTHWFTTLSYAYGISDTASKNYAAFRLGYFF